MTARQLQRCLIVLLLLGFGISRTMAIVHAGAAELPELQGPVNDFANIIDPATERQIDQLSRSLQAVTGDVIVVVTVPTVEPFADIREYAVKLFENGGRGIGQKGKDNGLLMLLAVKERRVWIEVGYGLEPWITDGYAGETSRDYMVPEFRNGRFGAGLLNGAARIAGRIAQGRNVTLTGVEVPREQRPQISTKIPFSVILLIFIAFLLFSRRLRGPRRGVRYWGGSNWSGWSSGVGPFGGGGGGGRSGGFGGGFGGFGGGRSGGGGGGSGW